MSSFLLRPGLPNCIVTSDLPTEILGVPVLFPLHAIPHPFFYFYYHNPNNGFGGLGVACLPLVPKFGG